MILLLRFFLFFFHLLEQLQQLQLNLHYSLRSTYLRINSLHITYITSVYSLVLVFLSNTQGSVSLAIQTPQIANTLLCIVFSTLFSVFGYSDEKLSLMFDILHE